ncbi:MAG: hypothetical protein ACIAQF_01185 [Phycisphaerales bacterium JB065]
MLIRTFVTTLIAAVHLLSPLSLAEVPNLTPEQLQKRAETIVIGAVLGNYERDAAGRRTTYITKLRVLESIKGDSEVGSEITGSWYRNRNMPMTTGTAGHRGTRPEVGGIVKVHLTADGSVLLPNGFQPADARYITDELIEEADPSAIRAACEEAARHYLFYEIIRGIDHLVESGDASTTDVFLLARAMNATGQYQKCMVVLKPLLKNDDADIRKQAVRIYMAAAWSMDDDEAFLNAIDELIEASEGEEKQSLEEYRQRLGSWFNFGKKD